MKTFAGSVMRALTFLSLMFFSAITLAEIRSDVDRETIGMGESLDSPLPVMPASVSINSISPRSNLIGKS